MIEEKIKISVVIPSFNEAENLSVLFSRLVNVFHELGSSYEIVVVDDGSSDDTLEILSRNSQENKNIKAISFSRNFGHQSALNAGLDYVSGETVVIMDADMQQPPELIKEMYQEYLNGCEIVLGARTLNKQNSFFREKFGGLFYYIMNKISGLNLEPNVADFGLFDIKVVKVLRQLPERDRFLRGLIQWVGFRKKFIYYKAQSRYKGKSKYNFRKLLSLGMSGITSFSAFPLRISWWVGLFIFCLSLAYSLYIIVLYYFVTNDIPAGWSTLIVVVCILGGLQLMMIGIVGEYLFKIFYEIKGRPLYIVKEVIGFCDDELNSKSKYGISSL